MENKDILVLIDETFHQTEGNRMYIEEVARDVTFFDEPLVGFSSAQDLIYENYKKPEIIGPRFMTPDEWLSGAKSVISISLPFTDQIRASTRTCRKDPSPEWMYGRVYGHAFMQELMRNLARRLEEQGVACCIPTEDKRYARFPRDYEIDGVMHRHMEIVWSERHAAYACGLGTFGLSRCLITSRGTAMRLISCITDLDLEPSFRNYENYMEYCTRCGTCIRRCPVNAITFEHSKNNILCGNWNNELKERHKPLYGCANCMTAVPCESGIPPLR